MFGLNLIHVNKRDHWGINYHEYDVWRNVYYAIVLKSIRIA